jgi:hypothetical protein
MIGQKIQASRDRFGKDDPFWAVLTRADKKGGKWQETEFFAMGRQDIQAAMEWMRRLDIKLSYGKALDFGCGPDRITQALAEYFQEVQRYIG